MKKQSNICLLVEQSGEVGNYLERLFNLQREADFEQLPKMDSLNSSQVAYLYKFKHRVGFWFDHESLSLAVTQLLSLTIHHKTKHAAISVAISQTNKKIQLLLDRMDLTKLETRSYLQVVSNIVLVTTYS